VGHNYQNKWSTIPLGASGEKLEFLRDYACFGEDRAGERTTFKVIEFSQEVVFAEIFLSGFNMWYTREGHDHEVMQLRVDAWIEQIGHKAGSEDFMSDRNVKIKLMYVMTDEDTSDSDDFNEACIGFTVVALTKPQV
jgi:hypothetical protein